jgi:hypothetical protein
MKNTERGASKMAGSKQRFSAPLQPDVPDLPGDLLKARDARNAVVLFMQAPLQPDSPAMPETTSPKIVAADAIEKAGKMSGADVILDL